MVLNASRGEEVGNEDQSSGGGPGGAGESEPGAPEAAQKAVFSSPHGCGTKPFPSAAPRLVNRSVPYLSQVTELIQK